MSVALEVSEAVGLTLKKSHQLGVKTFGGAIVLGEAPRGGDLVEPRVEGFAELRLACVPQLMDGLEKPYGR